MFNTNLVQTTTSDDLILTGLLNEPDTKADTAIVYIHGFVTDFYSHLFTHKMTETALQKGITFLAAQNRGTGMQSEVLKSDRLGSKTIGSYFEILEEAYLDIDAWIKYLKGLGYTKFILIGHSLGTHKVVRYLFEGTYKDEIVKLSLLGPFDKNAYVEKKSNGKWHEYVEESKRMIESGKPLEIIPDMYDDFPMTMQTFYSWYRPSDMNEMWDFYRMNSFDFPIWSQVKVPVQVVTGSIDESLEYPEYYSREEAYENMKKNISELDLRVIEGSTHCFVGFEDELAKVVADFL